MKIAIGSDHRGFKQKEVLVNFFVQETDIVCIDIGTHDKERTDYPVYAQKAAALILGGSVDMAILLCGSGIGMATAANRFPGIIAGVVWNIDIARIAREHDNVNVLVIPSDYVEDALVVPMVKAWLEARFLGGRYADRLMMIDKAR